MSCFPCVVFKVHVPFALLCLVSNKAFKRSGDKGIRTLDPLLARQVLSQLSYTPAWAYYFYHFSCFLSSVFLSHTVSSIVPSAVQVLTIVFGMGTGVSPARIATRNVCKRINPSSLTMGLSGLEPPTSRLSGVRSNRLSYKPISDFRLFYFQS